MAIIKNNQRYILDQFHAKSLEDNPLGSPVDRYIHIYLPPGYFDNKDTRYPTVYILHGYESTYRKPTIYADAADKYRIVLSLIGDLADQFYLDDMASYIKLDRMISAGEIEPCIIAQPDSSLHLPQLNNAIDVMTGEPASKGSWYVNSSFTGNYESYIAEDVIAYVDDHYRTFADRARRALIGTSMGGYGALSICLNRPGIFSVLAPIAPANFTLDWLSYKMRVPILDQIMGKEEAAKAGDASMTDILDTLDMVYSHDRPLLPTVKRDSDGKIINYDSKSAHNWESHELKNVIVAKADSLTNMNIHISCHKDDDFNLAPEVLRIGHSLKQYGVPNSIDIFTNPRAAFTPHTLGIAYHMLPTLKYCVPLIN